ncbi:MAG: tRNA (adenosine(37)-N6)-dimethylallyltransferase MiaA [Nitrospirae bacterium RBG_19FT_COMBO_42_15]|nr:MAG: tRNA (adenosine(37)-N6)-dimethylallyltransferase MiaA [Nitrospirae bacterium RBG_19FT_COMBO_42_15]
MTIPILVIVGPTAVGKTRIAIELAKELNGEIISADSRQIYKGMDIGTAKPSKDEQAAVKHHMLNVVEPDEHFSVGEYKRNAEKIIEGIWQRKRLPIIAGGTGLYIRAVIDGLWEGPKADYELRDKLKKEEETFGKGYLYKKLKEVDPETAEKTKPNDLVRIVRSLEVYYKEGKTISHFHRLHGFQEKNYNIMFIGLTMDRGRLYKKIEERVDEMINSGLIDEVKALLKKEYNENISSMTGVGYRQAIGYLKGDYNLEEAVRLIKRDTKRYAKRQYTWFNKDKRIEWSNIDDIDIKLLAQDIKKRLKLK